MSFRKRNIGLSSGSPRTLDNPPRLPTATLLGVRPSPLDGRLTTSTGTATLDGLLAGHAGLVLGTSLIVEESGTTDYAGALLRFYAAEGLVQGHHVHVVGLPEQWGRNLPGLNGSTEGIASSAAQDRMKIAWRYESLGQFGGGQASRGGHNTSLHSTCLGSINLSTYHDSHVCLADTCLIDRPTPPKAPDTSSAPAPFCHTFDLTKKLAYPAEAVIEFVRVGTDRASSPFEAVLEALSKSLATSKKDVVHRVVIPSLLSPALYPPHASMPQHVLRFMHSIRALLAAYSNRLTVMASLPLSLYPRSSGIVRWMELLNDGVMELSPFPHSSDVEFSSKPGSGAAEDPPQGLLRIHRLPVLHDRGSGTVSTGDDWAFNLSRRKFSIQPFSLPPVEGDTEAQQGADVQQKSTKADLDF